MQRLQVTFHQELVEQGYLFTFRTLLLGGRGGGVNERTVGFRFVGQMSISSEDVN